MLGREHRLKHEFEYGLLWHNVKKPRRGDKILARGVSPWKERNKDSPGGAVEKNMPSTFTKLYSHVVFSTKNRVPRVHPEISDRLYSYMGGIARNIGFDLILANGTEDHVHLIIKTPPRLSLSEIIRFTKSNSSKWIHETFPGSKDFSWQSGYSAFSVSQSKLQTAYQYVQDQREHHAKVSFKDELIYLLRHHEIKYDEQYLWE